MSAMTFLFAKAEDIAVGLGCLAIAAFVLTAACSNWTWFWGHRKARALTRFIGVRGARILYFAIGVLLIIASLLMLFTDTPER